MRRAVLETFMRDRGMSHFKLWTRSPELVDGQFTDVGENDDEFDVYRHLQQNTFRFDFLLLAIGLAPSSATCYDLSSARAAGPLPASPILDAFRNLPVASGNAAPEQVTDRAATWGLQSFQLFQPDLLSQEREERVERVRVRPPERVVLVQSLSRGKAVSVKGLRDLLTFLRDLAVHRLVLFAEKRLTNSALTLASLGVTLEWQPIPFLNIVQHELVPKHRRLTQSEAKTIRARFGKIRAKLRADDAVARYYGFPAGCVVEILTLMESTGLFPEFRLVV